MDELEALRALVAEQNRLIRNLRVDVKLAVEFLTKALETIAKVEEQKPK